MHRNKKKRKVKSIMTMAMVVGVITACAPIDNTSAKLPGTEELACVSSSDVTEPLQEPLTQNVYSVEKCAAVIPMVATSNDKKGEDEEKKTLTPARSSKPKEAIEEKPKTKKTKKDWNSNLYGPADVSGATAEELNALIDKIIESRGIKSTPLKNAGEALVEMEESYDISAVGVLSIFTIESGFGVSRLATDQNNFGGVRAGNGGWRSYADAADCINSEGKLLRNTYVNNGHDTWSEIQSIYCPSNYSWDDEISGTAKRYSEWLEDIMN
jgi:beta-N-acetylglucosaminidase